jgi:hypothetical protein
VQWRAKVNGALRRVTGFQLTRPAAAEAAAPTSVDGVPGTPPAPAPTTPRVPSVTTATTAPRLVIWKATPRGLVRPAARPEVDRLVPRPVFIHSSIRSGSTLLRSLLNSHSELHAPHELHVRRLRVIPSTKPSVRAMQLLGHNEADLEHLLWDRVMHRELVLSGKQHFVEKTPSNAFDWQRISTCWPDARYLFLLRHPGAIADSWARANPHRFTAAEAATDALRYIKALDRARDNLSGLTVRYEDLTTDPAAVTRAICTFLGVEWEPEMLSYDASETFEKGTGDWSDAIRSGQVQPGRTAPPAESVPEVLRPISLKWGYLEEPSQQQEA